VNDFLKINMNVEIMRYFMTEVPFSDWENLAADNLLQLSLKHLSEFRDEFSGYLDTDNSISG